MKRSRRISRIPDSHPGLFDGLDGLDDFGVPDIVAETVEKIRAREAAAAPATDDIPAIDPSAVQRTERLMFVSFGSGSSGNCAYVGTRHAGVLLDAGVDAALTLQRLRDNGIDFAGAVRGIILTHDHADHVRYAYPLLRRYPEKRLWATPKTLSGILRRHNISRRIKDYHQPIYKEFAFEVAGMTITPFETSHDGTDNVGFSIALGPETFVVATDMGYATERAMHYMAGATALMIESNYDAHMLATGRYPQYLQARIRGERGHMDNRDTAALLRRLWTPALHHVLLCHLSHDNNTPELAVGASREALEAAGATVVEGHRAAFARRPSQVQLTPLPRFDQSPLFIF